MTKKSSKFFSKIKLFASMPSLWLAAIILILAVVSIFVSKRLNDRGNSFESSVFANIFAGLSTGLIITLLSGSKSLYVIYLQTKLKWFQQFREIIHEHFSKIREMRKAFFNQSSDFYNIAYDTVASANHINERVVQSTFDKVKWFDPPKYFLKNYKYDSIKMIEVFSELREYLMEFGEESDMQKQVLDKIEDVSWKIIHPLNSNVAKEISTLEIKIGSAQKSII